MPLLPYESRGPTYKRIDELSTADTSYPEITFRHGDLTLRSTDWSEKDVCVVFGDVVAFRWQDEMPLPAGVHHAQAYEVAHSPFVAELAAAGALTGAAGYRHFIFCFNCVGAALEVVSAGMTVGRPIAGREGEVRPRAGAIELPSRLKRHDGRLQGHCPRKHPATTRQALFP